MKKCPFCAEDIKDEAIKCKHCGSDLQQEESKPKPKSKSKESSPIISEDFKKGFKWFWKILLAIFAIAIWYISIPAILIWYIWKKTKWSKKKKYIGTGLAIVLFGLLIGLNSYINRTPTLTISEPADGITVQTDEMLVKGTIDPKNAKLLLNQNEIRTIDGNFSITTKLHEEINTFTLLVSNSNGQSQQEITINRTFTEEELEKIEAERIRKEELEKAIIEAREKAEEERKAKELAEQQAWERSEAGQLCKEYPTWTKSDCERVGSGEKLYWIGMSYDMLVESYGSKPNHANPSNYGSGTSWQWCWTYYTPSCFYGDDDGIIDSYN